MKIVPVIDLKQGRVVHARHGRRDHYRPIETPLAPGSDPIAVVEGLLRLHPFPCVYAADLDAIEHRGNHDRTFKALHDRFPEVEFWIDNGLARAGEATAWLRAHRGCLVVGSESQKDTALLHALADHPRVILSLDFRGDEFVGPKDILDETALWPMRVIAMSLAHIGAARGPDLARVASLAQRAEDCAIHAAGGVRHIQDLLDLARVGAAGALVATALHDGSIDAAALQLLTQTKAPGV
jgi:phosphoribosylformimino-5-aminoimidazole carboxamide ribotide isomerase